MPSRIFISHSSSDKDVAAAVCSATEARGVLVWIAPRDVAAGRNYAEEILDGIEASSLVVVLLSEASIASGQVTREVERAVSLGIGLLPVRIDQTPLSRSLQYFLGTSQWLVADALGHADIAAAVADAVTAWFETNREAASASESKATPPPATVERPSGNVTLLFTDIEGSTAIWEAHPEEMEVALARHDALVRDAVERAHGYVFKTVGDAFCVAFQDAADAVIAAGDAQRALSAEPWPGATPLRVRMGLHTGACVERGGDYFGQPVNRAARLEATAHGRQVVMSHATEGLVRDRLPAGVTLRDLGEHRLKDLGRPEQVFQLCGPGLTEDFGPLRSLSNPALMTNLPVQASSFVGRDRELGEVRALIAGSRLVTLTGPGGSGKTRLALQAAAELVDGSGDGVWLVELAALADPELVAVKVANVLTVREEPGRPVLDTLVDGLRDRNLLLVLDNCEHVITAAAKLSDALLRSCPRVQLLATSREPLGIDGEHVYRVPSLDLPDADEADLAVLGASESVRMFVERAAQHRAGFGLDATNASTIARLCRRLDGIPLAIELAAARTRSMSVDDIESRVDQRFRLLTGGARTALPRQQTLRGLIDWSWELLNPAEQTVLARLGVFAGGWDLDAAAAVASNEDAGGAEGWSVADWEVLDLLDALVDKSLVQTSDAPGATVRYRLLETVRDYAITRLAEQGDAAAASVQTAHAGHYLAFAERADPQLSGADQDEWLERIETEHDNLRAALAHDLATSNPEAGLRLATALGRFWRVGGYAVEGVALLTALLDRPDAQEPTLLRGRALDSLANLLLRMSENAAAGTRAEESVAIGRAHGDHHLLASALGRLAFAQMRQKRANDALALADEALALARTVGDKNVTASGLDVRGKALLALGDRDGAQACYREARDLYRETGNISRADEVLINLGLVELARGELDAARASLTEALNAHHGHRDAYAIQGAAFNLGLAEVIHGDLGAARVLFSQTVTSGTRLGDPEMVAYSLLGLALTTSAGPATAATIHGAAAALLETLHEHFESTEAELRDSDHIRLRAQLGDEAFASAYESGRGLSRDDAIALALR